MVSTVEEMLELPVARWRDDLTVWDTIIERVRVHQIGSWLPIRMAVFAASRAAKTSSDVGANCEELFDEERNLVARVAYARQRSRSVAWWKSMYERIDSELDRKVFVACLVGFGSSAVIQNVRKELEALVEGFDHHTWGQVWRCIRDVGDRRRSVKPGFPKWIDVLPVPCAESGGLLRMLARPGRPHHTGRDG
jgi:hypothetical protein